MGARGPEPEQSRRLRMMTPAGSFFPHPEGMSEDAAELWRHIVDAHPRGYFQAGDVPLLRAYCEEYARRNRAERMLAEQGEVIETASGAVKPASCRVRMRLSRSRPASSTRRPP